MSKLMWGKKDVTPVLLQKPPTGAKAITEDGVYFAKDDHLYGYDTVVVSVSSGLSGKYGCTIDSILGDTSSNGVLLPPKSNDYLIFAGVTDLSSKCLYYRFYDSDIINHVLFPDLLQISGNNSMCYAFYNCELLTLISLPQLEEVSGYNTMQNAFENCVSLEDLTMPNLTTISGNDALNSAFRGCTQLSTLTLPNLTNITGGNSLKSAFYRCSRLTNATFPRLSNLTGSYCLQFAFRDCTSLESLSFPALTPSSFGNLDNQFNQMLLGVAGCTVHFPSSIYNTIHDWENVASGFGGNSTHIVFDLP